MRKRRLVWVGVVVVLGGLAAAALLDPDERARGWATGEPFYQGRAASAWRKELAAGDEVRSAAARDRLAAGKGEAVPVCGWLLRHAAEPAARWRAAEVLGKVGADAAPAGPALVAALADPDPLVRGAVVRTVGDLTPDPAAAVPALVKLFPEVEAIRAAARYKQDAAPAVPKLVELMKSHPDGAVRWQAARALGKIGAPAALPTLPDLVAVLHADTDGLVREHCAEALGDIGPPAAAAVPDLAKALQDPEHKVRRDAVRSLGQIGPAARPALDAVKALSADTEEIVRQAAAVSAKQIEGKK